MKLSYQDQESPDDFVFTPEMFKERRTRMGLDLDEKPKKKWTPTKCGSGWKALCWKKLETTVPFQVRHVFDMWCYLWFVKKQQPSLRALRNITGYQPESIKCITLRLRDMRLLEGDVPTYNEAYLMPKRTFDEKKWYKSVHNRTVNPVSANKLDCLWAFIEYRNDTKPGDFTGVSYLSTATGLPYGTVRRLVRQLIDAKRIMRKPNGDLVILHELEMGNRLRHLEHQVFKVEKVREILSPYNTPLTRDVCRVLTEAGMRKFKLFQYIYSGLAKKAGERGISLEALADALRRRKVIQ